MCSSLWGGRILIVLIVGDFCVGKDVVCDMMCDYIGYNPKYDDFTVNKIQSYTTRAPRFEGESTHTFCTKDEFNDFDDIIAMTIINDEFYGARASQFNLDDKNHFDVYVVDPKGVYDIVHSGIDADSIHTVEVVRPKWLRDCPKERLDRKSDFNITPIDYNVSYRIINDGDLAKLRRLVEECIDFLCKKYL